MPPPPPQKTTANENEDKDKGTDKEKDMEVDVDEMHALLDALVRKYKDEPHMLAKIATYIGSTLPAHLDSHKQSIQNRALCRKRDEDFRSDLTHRFMTTSNYYYCPVTETYFTYDFRTYVVVSEDFVRNHIYCTLTNNNVVSSLKYKTMRIILKAVKERNILNAIPESATIQTVLKIFPEPYVLSKNIVKYFLTIIGDCILKKNVNMCYFLSPKMKPLMRELSNRCYEYLGCDTISRRFKYKFHEQHSIADCRLIMQLQFSAENIQIIHAHALDLICVASHYSTRYKSGDDFLGTKSYDHNLCNYVYFLKHHNNVNSVVLEFIAQMLEITNDDCTTLTMKNMIFLWKRYCEQVFAPSVVVRSQLKQHLTPHLKYCEETDCFTGVTSAYMPMVSNFLKFWSECTAPASVDEHYYYTSKEHDNIIEIEYEIEEVCHMFKAWSPQKHAASETLILKLIKHFFDDMVTIEEEKYIYGVKVKMWNKPKDVMAALSELRSERGAGLSTSTLYDVYESYYEKRKAAAVTAAFAPAAVSDPSPSSPSSFSYVGGIVSKRYFEKCIRELFPLSLTTNDDSIVLLDWTKVETPSKTIE
jgi:hypothetical protein